MKKKFLDFYFKVATDAADLSYARRLKVGAVIVKNDSILSYGYNGTPGGFDNNCENIIEDQLITKPEVIHAEMNAVAKAAKSGYSCDGASMFVTHSPCVECAKLISQSGFVRVYYKEAYRSANGLQLLNKKGIETIHYA